MTTQRSIDDLAKCRALFSSRAFGNLKKLIFQNKGASHTSIYLYAKAYRVKTGLINPDRRKQAERLGEEGRTAIGGIHNTCSVHVSGFRAVGSQVRQEA
jgi:hypothetical protein